MIYWHFGGYQDTVTETGEPHEKQNNLLNQHFICFTCQLIRPPSTLSDFMYGICVNYEVKMILTHDDPTTSTQQQQFMQSKALGVTNCSSTANHSRTLGDCLFLVPII